MQIVFLLGFLQDYSPPRDEREPTGLLNSLEKSDALGKSEIQLNDIDAFSERYEVRL